jgi:RNA polymerase subunit RPABC4/transcription elongation factor Spt4
MTDTCICCGEIVPEGRMVCPNCEAGATKQEARYE